MRRLLVAFLLLPLVAQAGFPFSFWKTSALLPPPTPTRWYDASTLGLANGATVSTWTERLGNTGNNGILLGTGTAPTYTTYSQNGLSTILFSNSARYYSTAWSVVIPATVAAIVNVRNGGAGGAIFGAVTLNGPTFFVRDGGAPYTMQINKSFVGNAGNATSTFTGNAWHLIVFTITGSNWEYYVDGVSVGSGTNSLGAFFGTVEIGAENSGNFQRFDGSMGEILHYTSVLSAGDLALLHTYAQLKWGTP